MNNLATLVRVQRERLGLGQSELGDLVDRSKSWIVDLERGKTTRFHPDDLERLARALAMNPAEVVSAALVSWLGPSAAIPELNAIAEAVIAEEQDELRVCKSRSSLEIEERAEALALELFPIAVEIGLPIGVEQLTYLDVTPPSLARINWSKMPRDASAEGQASFCAVGDTIEIGIREDVWMMAEAGDGRARFTMAHELGHAVLHGNDLRQKDARAFRDVTCTATAGDKLIPGMKIYQSPEWQANVFASAFLMPKDAVKSWVNSEQCQNPDYLTIEQLSQQFKVSYQAARIRLERLIARRAL
jgi:transcriptional regulator with XRE-family HTH domain